SLARRSPRRSARRCASITDSPSPSMRSQACSLSEESKAWKFVPSSEDFWGCGMSYRIAACCVLLAACDRFDDHPDSVPVEIRSPVEIMPADFKAAGPWYYQPPDNPLATCSISDPVLAVDVRTTRCAPRTDLDYWNGAFMVDLHLETLVPG